MLPIQLKHIKINKFRVGSSVSKNLLKPCRLFSTTDDSDADRGEQAKGAMSEYLRKFNKKHDNESNTDTGDSFFARIRRERAGETGNKVEFNRQLSPNPNATKGFKRRPVNIRTQGPKSRLGPKKNTVKKSDEGANFSRISPVVEALLSETEYFRNMAKKGATTAKLDTLDPLERYLVDTFVESFKTESGVVEEINIEKSFYRMKPPKEARSLKQLLAYMNSNIESVPKESYAYQLADEAWMSVHENHTFTEKQKYQVRDRVIAISQQFQDFMEQENSKKDEVELIFQPQFRKGLEYLEEETKQNLMKNTQKNEGLEFQGETDWDVEAVEDEDQLFD